MYILVRNLPCLGAVQVGFCLFICLLGERKKCQVAKENSHILYLSKHISLPPAPPPDIAALKSTGNWILKVSNFRVYTVQDKQYVSFSLNTFREKSSEKFYSLLSFLSKRHKDPLSMGQKPQLFVPCSFRGARWYLLPF